MDEISGWLLFKGTVIEKEWEDREGYYWGTHKLRGMDEFEGREFKYFSKMKTMCLGWMGNRT